MLATADGGKKPLSKGKLGWEIPNDLYTLLLVLHRNPTGIIAISPVEIIFVNLSSADERLSLILYLSSLFFVNELLGLTV